MWLVSSAEFAVAQKKGHHLGKHDFLLPREGFVEFRKQSYDRSLSGVSNRAKPERGGAVVVAAFVGAALLFKDEDDEGRELPEELNAVDDKSPREP